MQDRKIKVLIVDDSAIVRKILAEALGSPSRTSRWWEPRRIHSWRATRS